MEFGVLGPVEVRVEVAWLSLGGGRPRAVLAALPEANPSSGGRLLKASPEDVREVGSAQVRGIPRPRSAAA